jgi:hypothetical protein
MKLLAAAMVLMTLAGVRAQTPADPFAERPPDETSPFFALAGLDELERLQQRKISMPQKGYPRMPAPDATLEAKLRGFYSGLVSSFQNRSENGQETATLSVTPLDPSLSETRELDVTYTIRNTGRRMTRIEFPTSQRLEILTRNTAGAVVERWSDDRAFQPLEGIEVINPKERLEFQEKVPTRDMRPGAAYTVEASLATEPNFGISQTILPR